MALLSIGAVGDAVRQVQEALNRGVTALPRLDEDGIFGPKTRSRVVEFQGQKNLTPDGIVGPLTTEELLKLLFPPKPIDPTGFTGCDISQMRTVTDDIERAKEFLDNAISLLDLAPFVPTIGQVVENVFKIPIVSASNPIEQAFAGTELLLLKRSYMTIRGSLDRAFPKQCEVNEGIFAAFVSNNFADETMHFSPRYFRLDPEPFAPTTRAVMDDEARAATIIHERAHTVLRLSGHPGTMDSPIGVKPHLGSQFPPITHDQAMANAYCYEWLAIALKPGYNPSKYPGPDVIVGS
jgi:Putative peptidoglycan binding domain